MYIIKLPYGEYFRLLEGNDWDRVAKKDATTFSDRITAEEWVRTLDLASFDAMVERLDHDD